MKKVRGSTVKFYNIFCSAPCLFQLCGEPRGGRRGRVSRDPRLERLVTRGNLCNLTLTFNLKLISSSLLGNVKLT